MKTNNLRLRLVIRRHALPEVRVVFSVQLEDDPTIANLLEQVNELVPLESNDWGLEDYTVELRDSDGHGFDCMHFQQVSAVLKNDEEIYIRPLVTEDRKKRRLSGRHQISTDGKHLIDGIAFGRPRLRTPRDRPPIEIPPLKRRRLTDDDDEENDDQDEDFAPLLLTEHGERHGEQRKRVRISHSGRDAHEYELPDSEAGSYRSHEPHPGFYSPQQMDEEEYQSSAESVDYEHMEDDPDELDEEVRFLGAQQDQEEDLEGSLVDPADQLNDADHNGEDNDLAAEPANDADQQLADLEAAERDQMLRHLANETAVAGDDVVDEAAATKTVRASELGLDTLDKITALRAAFPSASADYCERVLQRCDGDEQKAYKKIKGPHDAKLTLKETRAHYHRLQAHSLDPGHDDADADDADDAGNVDDAEGSQESDAESVDSLVKHYDQYGFPAGSIMDGTASAHMVTALRMSGQDVKQPVHLRFEDDVDTSASSRTVAGTAQPTASEAVTAQPAVEESQPSKTLSLLDDQMDDSEDDEDFDAASSDSSSNSDDDSSDSDSGPEVVSSKKKPVQHEGAMIVDGMFSSSGSESRTETSSESSSGSHSGAEVAPSKKTAGRRKRAKKVDESEEDFSSSSDSDSDSSSSDDSDSDSDKSDSDDSDSADNYHAFGGNVYEKPYSSAGSGSDSSSADSSSESEQEPVRKKAKTHAASASTKVASAPASTSTAVESAPPAPPAETAQARPGEGTTATQRRNARRREAAKAKKAAERDTALGTAGTADFEAKKAALLQSLALLDESPMDVVSADQQDATASSKRKSKVAKTQKSTDAPTLQPEADSSEDWRQKINYSAVECCEEGVELSEPPFPFVQRWDPQQRKGWKKKGGNKRRQDYQDEDSTMSTKKTRRQEYDDHDNSYYEDSYYTTGNQTDDITLNYDDDVTLNYDDEVLPDERIHDPSHICLDEDLPSIPDDVSVLPVLHAGDAKPGMVITWKQLLMSKATNWQPQMLSLVGLVDEVFDSACFRVQLAKRDRNLDRGEKTYDEEGNRVYDKFEVPEDDEDLEEGAEEGYRTLEFDDLLEPRVLRGVDDEVEAAKEAEPEQRDDESETPAPKSLEREDTDQTATLDHETDQTATLDHEAPSQDEPSQDKAEEMQLDEAAMEPEPEQREDESETPAPKSLEREDTDQTATLDHEVPSQDEPSQDKAEEMELDEADEAVEEPVEQPVEQPVEEPAQEQLAEEPVIEEQVIEPVVEELAQPVTEEPVAKEQSVEPVVEEPVVEQTVIEQPIVEEPVVELSAEPVAEEPAVEEPVVEEPLVEQQSGVQEQVVEDQPSNEQVVEEQHVEGQVVEEPAKELAKEVVEQEAVQEQVVEEQVVGEQTAIQQNLDTNTIPETSDPDINQMIVEEQVVGQVAEITVPETSRPDINQMIVEQQVVLRVAETTVPETSQAQVDETADEVTLTQSAFVETTSAPLEPLSEDVVMAETTEQSAILETSTSQIAATTGAEPAQETKIAKETSVIAESIVQETTIPASDPAPNGAETDDAESMIPETLHANNGNDMDMAEDSLILETSQASTTEPQAAQVLSDMGMSISEDRRLEISQLINDAGFRRDIDLSIGAGIQASGQIGRPLSKPVSVMDLLNSSPQKPVSVMGLFNAGDSEPLASRESLSLHNAQKVALESAPSPAVTKEVVQEPATEEGLEQDISEEAVMEEVQQVVSSVHSPPSASQADDAQSDVWEDVSDDESLAASSQAVFHDDAPQAAAQELPKPDSQASTNSDIFASQSQILLEPFNGFSDDDEEDPDTPRVAYPKLTLPPSDTGSVPSGRQPDPGYGAEVNDDVMDFEADEPVPDSPSPALSHTERETTPVKLTAAQDAISPASSSGSGSSMDSFPSLRTLSQQARERRASASQSQQSLANAFNREYEEARASARQAPQLQADALNREYEAAMTRLDSGENSEGEDENDRLFVGPREHDMSERDSEEDSDEFDEGGPSEHDMSELDSDEDESESVAESGAESGAEENRLAGDELDEDPVHSGAGSDVEDSYHQEELRIRKEASGQGLKRGPSSLAQELAAKPIEKPQHLSPKKMSPKKLSPKKPSPQKMAPKPVTTLPSTFNKGLPPFKQHMMKPLGSLGQPARQAGLPDNVTQRKPMPKLDNRTSPQKQAPLSAHAVLNRPYAQQKAAPAPVKTEKGVKSGPPPPRPRLPKARISNGASAPQGGSQVDCIVIDSSESESEPVEDYADDSVDETFEPGLPNSNTKQNKNRPVSRGAAPLSDAQNRHNARATLGEVLRNSKKGAPYRYP